uniref:SOCS box domain-containing protein n=1 Tax=Mola mola TaxID=94237 RepID=A0A3Q3XC59_MOLML
MAAPSISHSGSSAPVPAFEDYSLYSNLSDHELMQLAIERSLTDTRGNAAPEAPNYSSPNPPCEKPPDPYVPLFVFLPLVVSAESNKQGGAEEPLFQAVRAGDVSTVKALATLPNTNLMLPSKPGWLAIHQAAWYGQDGCLRVLLSAQPGMVNKRTERGESALMVAVGKEQLRCVQVLLESGADPDIPNYDRETPLYKGRGWTALQEAVGQNNVEICEMLLKAGAKHDLKNVYGISPLFTAAQSGHVAALRFLLKHADANKPGKTGLLPLIVSLLIQSTSKARVRRTGISPLHLAAERNRDEVLEILMEAGFDVNAQLSEEWSKLYEDRRSTALYFSVFNNNIEAVRSLLAAGANPNLDLFRPLMVAARHCCIQTVTLLVEHGADINACIPTHPTTFPAVYMFSMKYLPLFKYLLDHGGHALSCFTCVYGNGPHPPINTARSERGGLPQASRFCEMISASSISRWAGPIIDILLDYVGHVTLCSRLMEHLNSYSDWSVIKEKAAPPRPLLQLCRLQILQLVGRRRLNKLPLPASLIRFLKHQQGAEEAAEAGAEAS